MECKVIRRIQSLYSHYFKIHKALGPTEQMKVPQQQVQTEGERIYDFIMQNQEARGIEISDLGEEMAVGKQVIRQYWKPRFLIDHLSRTVVEFMSLSETLQTVSQDDIMWETLASAEAEAKIRAQDLSFHFPSHIYKYNDGVAAVQWQLNPDGMYYMDDDGFGMTTDVEYNIYGFIDRRGRVLSKFRHISNDGELDDMRREAQGKIKSSSFA